MEMIKEWVCNIFIMILILSFIEMVLPDTSISKYIKFIFSLVVMSAIVYPLYKILQAY